MRQKRRDFVDARKLLMHMTFARRNGLSALDNPQTLMPDGEAGQYITATNQSSALEASGVENGGAGDDGADDLDIFDLGLVHGERIVGEDDEVGKFAGCDGAFDGFFV